MRRVAAATAALLVACAIAATSAGATGTTITVNTTETAFTSGDGLCSLAEAIAYADGTPESDCSSASPSGTTTIDIPAGQYVIAGTLTLSADVAIVGAGTGVTTISGGGSFQVVSVASGKTASISGVTIEDGQAGVSTAGCNYIVRSCPAENGFNGGGIYNDGTLNLTDDLITGNATSAGTAPYSLEIACTSNCDPKTGQSAGNGGSGGGIYNDDGATLTIDDSTLTDNVTGAGGNGTNGVSGTGTNSSAGQPGGDGGNAGNGAAIASLGTLSISDSTVADNVTGSSGLGGTGSDATAPNSNGGDGGAPGTAGEGAIYSAGKLTITGSTLSDNSTGAGTNGASGGQGSGSGTAGYGGGYSVGGIGGAIYDDGSQGALTNVTIAGNSVTDASRGGGIFDNGGAMQLSFVTIAGNTASYQGGGIATNGGSVSLADSIIADNTAFQGGNCSSTSLTDAGGDLSFGTDTSCPGTFADPNLGALADNGGPVQTKALGSGSAAIDLAPASACAAVTTDARGVARPQGEAGCDAGAYQVAPPVITGVAAGPTADTATVSAQVSPNLTDTKVTVDYGTSTAYGSQTAVRDLGAGNGATAFSANLGGLQPNTTYHAKLVATNADGTSSSSDLSFTTKPVATAALTSGAASGGTLTIPLTCNSSSTACSGTLTLTSHVTTRGSTVVGIAASAGRAKPKPKPKPKPVTALETVGGGSYTISPGTTQNVLLSLNRAGVKLLNARYSVPATLTMTGAVQLSSKVVFAYGRIHAKVSIAWKHASGRATPKRVSITALPAHAGVTVLCHGHGCGFAKRSFTPKGGALSLTAALARHALAKGAVLTIEVTAAGDVGQVVQYEIAHGGVAKLRSRCLVPGARTPSVCA